MPEGPEGTESKNNIVPYEVFRRRLEEIRARQLEQGETVVVDHFDKLLELTKSIEKSRELMLQDMIATEANFENIRRDFINLGGEPQLAQLFSDFHTAAEELRTTAVETSLREWRTRVDRAFEQLLTALEDKLSKPRP